MAYLDSSSKLTGLVAVTLMAYFDDACLAGIALPMILGATQFQHLFQKAYDQFQSNSTRLEWIMHALFSRITLGRSSNWWGYLLTCTSSAIRVFPLYLSTILSHRVITLVYCT